MKLLLITDSLLILSVFESKNDMYYFGEIQVDAIYLHSMGDIQKLETILAQRAYHLVLSLTEGVFGGNYVQNQRVVNAVNNYTTRFLETESTMKYTNMVNRTTSYFNIFLEIEKAVSSDEWIEEIKRIDVISAYNFSIARLASQFRANYYVLNYQGNFPTDMAVDILQKLE